MTCVQSARVLFRCWSVLPSTRDSSPPSTNPSQYFPNVDGANRARLKDLRIRHLLTMTAGLTWNELVPYASAANSEFQMNLSKDPYQFVLSRAFEHSPGMKWTYGGGATQLLAGIIEKSSGRQLAVFAQETLFAPLGIENHEWLKMPVSQATAAASGLRLRPRDMAKIGQLVLSKGLWNGRQIVSEAWITESTTPSQFDIDDYPSIAYAYQWWTDWEEIAGRRINWVSAQGLGGQRIYIVPRLDLVAVITAGNYGPGEDSSQSYRVFRDQVLSAVRD